MPAPRHRRPQRPRESKDRKRLVTFIEIDRCATDAIAVVTGCRLGKRAIKFRDWGKMAATFVDLASPLPPQGDTPVYKAIRIAALESSRQRARDLYPHIENKNQQQMLAYRELPDEDLFSEEWVAVPIHPREMPGYKSTRISLRQSAAKESTTTAKSAATKRFSAKPAPPPKPATTSPSRRAIEPHKQQGRRGNLSATGPLNIVKTLRQTLPAIPIAVVVMVAPIMVAIRIA